MAACTRRDLLTAAAVLAGCRSQDDTVRLVTAGVPASLSYLPHVLAEQLGFYRRQGLHVSVQTVSGGSRGLRSLVGGSADVVVGYFDHPVRITAQGRPALAFVTLARFPGNVVVAAPGKARNLADLRSATIGIPDLSSQAHLFLNYLLARSGVDPADVCFVPVGVQASGLAALENGKIDAWAGFDPGVSRYLLRHPDAVLLADARTATGLRACIGTDEYVGAVMYSTPEWLDLNSRKAHGLASAVCSALRWVKEHNVEQIAEAVPATVRSENRALYLTALKNSLELYSPDGRIEARGAAAVHRVLSASFPGAQVDLAQTYTNRFVEAA